MKKYHLSKLASHLKKHRARMKLTREVLAKRANVNYNTIIKLESGANRNPTIATLVGLAQVFKCGIEDLIS